jgi:hypothetical protein
VHVIGDVISDWDSIISSFEQLIFYFKCLKSSSAQSIYSLPVNGGGNAPATYLEIEKINSAIDRFKIFSVFLSDNALVKLMTSLVALSMNNLANDATNNANILTNENSNINGSDNSYNQNVNVSTGNQSQSYLNNPDREIISFSLNSVIEITKLNSYRISTVWQMVTSHLRMVASVKVIIILLILYLQYVTRLLKI